MENSLDLLPLRETEPGLMAESTALFRKSESFRYNIKREHFDIIPNVSINFRILSSKKGSHIPQDLQVKLESSIIDIRN